MDLGSLEDDHTIQTISVRHKKFHFCVEKSIAVPNQGEKPTPQGS